MKIITRASIRHEPLSLGWPYMLTLEVHTSDLSPLPDHIREWGREVLQRSPAPDAWRVRWWRDYPTYGAAHEVGWTLLDVLRHDIEARISCHWWGQSWTMAEEE